METSNLWNAFLKTGAVSDYLAYKSKSSDAFLKERKGFEIHDRRIDNKGR